MAVALVGAAFVEPLEGLEQPADLGGRDDGSMLATDRTARPSLVPVVTSRWPPATLCRTALSTS
jgi:hypothetical protein